MTTTFEKRRDFFKITSTLAAAALSQKLFSAAHAAELKKVTRYNSKPKRMLKTDVVVIGAGFAGITAARELVRAGKKVIVLEARDRIGGRTHTEEIIPGITLDVGGQWIGPTQVRMNGLAKQFKIETFATYDAGENVLERGGKLSKYTGTIPSVNPASLADLGISMSRLDKLALTVDVQEPWKTKNAAELDSQTLGTWIDSHTYTDTSKRLLWSGLEMIFATDPRRISLLHALFVIKTCQGLDILFGVTGGAQQDRFRFGTEPLLSKMAEEFARDVYLSSPVISIEQNQNKVTAICDGFRVEANRMVLAIPPAIAGRLQYAPGLSTDRDQLTQSMPMGSVIKTILVYPTPFWREKKMSGQTVSLSTDVFSTFDNSLPQRSEGILVAFSIGSGAERMRRLSEGDRKKAFLSSLSNIFGEAATTPVHYSEHSWSSEKYTGGCFFGVLPPGVLTGLGHSLWKPEGRIHFAGTETAREWNGYIEGAVESGERVAKEIMEASI